MREKEKGRLESGLPGYNAHRRHIYMHRHRAACLAPWRQQNYTTSQLHCDRSKDSYRIVTESDLESFWTRQWEKGSLCLAELREKYVSESRT